MRPRHRRQKLSEEHVFRYKNVEYKLPDVDLDRISILKPRYLVTLLMNAQDTLDSSAKLYSKDMMMCAFTRLVKLAKDASTISEDEAVEVMKKWKDDEYWVKVHSTHVKIMISSTRDERSQQRTTRDPEITTGDAFWGRFTMPTFKRTTIRNITYSHFVRRFDEMNPLTLTGNIGRLELLHIFKDWVLNTFGKDAGLIAKIEACKRVGNLFDPDTLRDYNLELENLLARSNQSTHGIVEDEHLRRTPPAPLTAVHESIKRARPTATDFFASTHEEESSAKRSKTEDVANVPTPYSPSMGPATVTHVTADVAGVAAAVTGVTAPVTEVAASVTDVAAPVIPVAPATINAALPLRRRIEELETALIAAFFRIDDLAERLTTAERANATMWREVYGDEDLEEGEIKEE